MVIKEAYMLSGHRFGHFNTRKVQIILLMICWEKKSKLLSLSFLVINPSHLTYFNSVFMHFISSLKLIIYRYLKSRQINFISFIFLIFSHALVQLASSYLR